jgi:tRNA-2-methylthio-N6-dimethylallyladenosine synthase
MKYFLMVLGCQMNLSDAERIRTVLDGLGLEETVVEEEANLIGIVACSVRQRAIDRVYSRIHKWNKWKKKRHLVTFVSGCVLDADGKKFAKLFDFLFKMDHLLDLGDLLRQVGMLPNVEPIELVSDADGLRTDYWKVEPSYSSDIEAFIQIQNGCNKFCTYCAVPYTRGREISRSSSEILDELKLLVERGNKVITLLGQNVNSYGFDRNGEELSFAQLLEKIGEYGLDSGREFWVYFTAPHPHDMTNDVLEMVAKYPHLAKQIHLPVQSGDDDVLARMNRRYTVADYMKIIDEIRRLLPTATVFTDVIVGFLDESEENFQNTVRLMREVKFNMAYIAMYSPRPGAKAARIEDEMPKVEKNRRHRLLSEILCEESFALNRAMVGKVFRVLVENVDPRVGDCLRGRTEGKLIVRIKGASPELVGEFVDVEITEASNMSMTGVLV